MVANSKEKDFTKLVRLLEVGRGKGSTVLFLGAKTGGLFRSEKFYDFFEEDNLHKLSKSLRFEKCYEYLREEHYNESELDIYLKDWLQDVPPLEADVRLAELIQRRFFSLIISTNIDRILNESLAKKGMKDGQDYHLFIPRPIASDRVNAIDRFERAYATQSCRVIKAFGDLIDQEYKMVGKEFNLDEDHNFKDYLQRSLRGNVLVIGYDPNWDARIEPAFAESGGMLWYVDEDQPIKNSLISRVVESRQGAVVLASYTTFIEMLHTRLLGGRPIDYQLTKNFVNRDTEMNLIDKAFAAIIDKQNLLGIPAIELYGVNGIGKTTILRKIEILCKDNDVPYIWIDSTQNLLALSKDVVKQVEAYKVRGIYENSNEKKPTEFVRAAKALLKQKERGVLLVDSLDPTNEDQIKWIEEMFIDLVDEKNLFVVFASKTMLMFDRLRTVSGKIKPLPLKSLNQENSEKYISKIGKELEPDTQRLLVKWTQGYPLAIDVMVQAIRNNNLNIVNSEDRKKLVAVAVKEIIDRRVLAKVDPRELNFFQTMLSLLSVPRRLNLVIMQDIVFKFAPMFALSSRYAYIMLQKRINRVTGALNWFSTRSGFSVDASVRNLLLLQMKIETPVQFYDLHRFLADENKKYYAKTSGTDQVHHLQEFLYHSAEIEDGTDFPRILEEMISQIMEEPQSFFQFSEDFSQDEELKEVLGIYTQSVSLLIHQKRTQIYKTAASKSEGAEHIRDLRELFYHLISYPKSIDISVLLQNSMLEIIESEPSEVLLELFKEIEQDNILRKALSDDFAALYIRVRRDAGLEL